MKTKLLFLLLSTLSFTPGFSQTLEPLLDTTKQWTDIIKNSDYPIYGSTSTYKLSGKIILDTLEYFKLYKSEGDPNFENWVLHGYMRETTDGKVYLRQINPIRNILLYDFNMQPGDSIVYSNWGDGIKMDSVSFYEFAWKIRKHIFCHIIPDFSTYHTIIPLVEGIGAIEFGFLNILDVGMTGGIWGFLCYKQNDELLYHLPGSTIEGCYYFYNSVKPVLDEEKTFQIIPNPLESKGKIKTKVNLKFPVILEVFTLSEVKALEVKIQKAEQEISFSTLTPGIYICRIKLNNKILISKIVVK